MRMKLIYRHPRTRKQIVKRFNQWPDLLNETWRVYYRKMNWPKKVECVCEAGWDAFDEVLP